MHFWFLATIGSVLGRNTEGGGSGDVVTLKGNSKPQRPNRYADKELDCVVLSQRENTVDACMNRFPVPSFARPRVHPDVAFWMCFPP
jgi:hypothetical protein